MPTDIELPIMNGHNTETIPRIWARPRMIVTITDNKGNHYRHNVSAARFGLASMYWETYLRVREVIRKHHIFIPRGSENRLTSVHLCYEKKSPPADQKSIFSSLQLKTNTIEFSINANYFIHHHQSGPVYANSYIYDKVFTVMGKSTHVFNDIRLDLPRGVTPFIPSTDTAEKKMQTVLSDLIKECGVDSLDFMRHMGEWQVYSTWVLHLYTKNGDELACIDFTRKPGKLNTLVFVYDHLNGLKLAVKRAREQNTGAAEEVDTELPHSALVGPETVTGVMYEHYQQQMYQLAIDNIPVESTSVSWGSKQNRSSVMLSQEALATYDVKTLYEIIVNSTIQRESERPRTFWSWFPPQPPPAYNEDARAKAADLYERYDWLEKPEGERTLSPYPVGGG